MMSISLFYCCEKVFTHMITQMTGKNSRTLLTEKEHFYMEDITDADYMHAKTIRILE